MNRVRIRDLALVAVASGLLAFEVTSLQGASKDAALATASVLRGVGAVTTHAAIGAVKGAARLLGTVTPPVDAGERVLVTSRGDARRMVQHIRVATLGRDACRPMVAAGIPVRQARRICRELETARVGSTL